jgi:hypothetical protein
MSTALEQRADVEELDELQAKRRELMEEYGRLEALHAHNGMWDAHRRALRGAIGAKIRNSPQEHGFTKAPSNEAVEDAACAAPEYKRFLEQGLNERVRYIQLKNEIVELSERIENRFAELRAYTAETYLGR